jgi:flagellar operon protein
MSRIGSVGGSAPLPSLSNVGMPESAPGFGDSLDALLRPPPAVPNSGTVQFSKHAAARMESRGIDLDEGDRADLGAAIDQLARRGSKESLVLMGDHAFIVGVPDRKVVTVMTRQEAAGNIFTNIDSTAVVR